MVKILLFAKTQQLTASHEATEATLFVLHFSIANISWEELKSVRFPFDFIFLFLGLFSLFVLERAQILWALGLMGVGLLSSELTQHTTYYTTVFVQLSGIGPCRTCKKIGLGPRLYFLIEASLWSFRQHLWSFLKVESFAPIQASEPQWLKRATISP